MSDPADAAIVADAAQLGTPTPPLSQATPTPQDPETTVAADPGATAPVEPVTDPAPILEAPKPVDWRERRMGELAAQKRALEDRLAALEAKPKETPQADGEARYTEAEVLTRANDLALRRTQDMRFNDQCNDVFSKGSEKFQDFQSTLGSFSQLGGLNRQFVEAVLQAGDKAPEVLYTLGKDLNEAARIMSLPPMEQAYEIARRALTEAPKATVSVDVSKAPAPIKPKVGGATKAEPSVYDDTISTADWITMRNKQLQGRNTHH